MTSNLTKTKPQSMATSRATSSKSSPSKRTSNRPSIILLHQGNHSGSDSSTSGSRSKRQSSSRQQPRNAADSDTDNVRRIAVPRSAPAKSFLSEDLWEMPKTKAGQDNLTWQQTLFSSAKPRAHRRQDSAVDMTPDRPVSATAGGSMTWQQQMLSKPSPGKKGTARGRRQRGESAKEESDASDSPTPNHLEGSLAALSLVPTPQDPFTIDDLFATSTPIAPASAVGSPVKSATKKTIAQPRPKSASAAQAPILPAPILLSRPKPASTASMPVQMTPNHKYAGPEFHNSPSAASLPPPTFLRSIRANS